MGLTNCKCDYCGHHDYKTDAGNKCPKCKQGIMCARGTKGWPNSISKILGSIKK